MSYHEQSRKTFVAAGPIPQDALVKLTADGVTLCGAGENPLGVTEVGAHTLGAPVGVRLINTPGTVEVQAFGPVTPGQLLTSAEDGMVAPHSAGLPVVGIALHAAAAQGMLEMMPFFQPHAATA